MLRRIEGSNTIPSVKTNGINCISLKVLICLLILFFTQFNSGRICSQSTYVGSKPCRNSSGCCLRMNRYPPCPKQAKVFGLMPHTDSDFLMILHQDQVGGLQLVKDRKWIAINPNPEALIINIGDLLQAWSNDVYKSVQHRVVTNSQVERFSIAYFFCPSCDTVIQTGCKPSVYKRFSFGEFRRQVQDDVRKHSNKIGLPRFLA